VWDPFAQTHTGWQAHVRPHPIGAVAARTTGEPTASRRQWRVGVPMADPMRPQETKDQEGAPLRGEAVRQGTLETRVWPTELLATDRFEHGYQPND
jgi:hypothetical protein